ncbi:hypothetical protein BJV74DRAFT_441224 [Russula compacta]|nr:hypothetical protein BJV74DRAFT_441224 [Russula compacta]
MPAPSPTPSFPGAWPDWSSTDVVPSLPDKYIPPHTIVDNDDTPQDISPSLFCLSPRPLPELPSLSSSLSTAESSVTTGSYTPPEQPCSPVEVQPACIPLQIDPPIILDLREPHSPDSAHFSPPDDSISFPSPSSSQLQLSLSNNCPGTRSVESVATYLPSPSSPNAPDDERGARQEDESRSEEDIISPYSQADLHENSLHAAKITVGKRTFLSRVKRFGGRVRKLFKPRVAETKPWRNSVSSLVSPRKPSILVNVRLPAAVPESPTSRQGLPRRFSLQSLLHPRLPSGSAESSSRATTGNRLSTIVSARVSAREEYSSSLENTRLPDASAADISGMDPADEQKVGSEAPMTTETLHGLGIGAQESTSIASPDSA